MDPQEIRSNTRSGTTYQPDEAFAPGGLPVPAALHIPANTSQTCLAGEGPTISPCPTSGDPAQDARPQSSAYPHIPANTSQKCLAGLARARNKVDFWLPKAKELSHWGVLSRPPLS